MPRYIRYTKEKKMSKISAVYHKMDTFDKVMLLIITFSLMAAIAACLATVGMILTGGH